MKKLILLLIFFFTIITTVNAFFGLAKLGMKIGMKAARMGSRGSRMGGRSMKSTRSSPNYGRSTRFNRPRINRNPFSIRKSFGGRKNAVNSNRPSM